MGSRVCSKLFNSQVYITSVTIRKYFQLTKEVPTDVILEYNIQTQGVAL